MAKTSRTAKSPSKKKATSKASSKKTTSKKTSKKGGRGRDAKVPSTVGKDLVIVESPSKARTINKYLGDDYVVLASVGHVRDLPSKNPKGDKSPVPGVDLDNNFAPTYEVLSGKTRAISDLKRAAKSANTVWFATDLDREGEAIAWHLAEVLGIDPLEAKRVIFAAITKEDISLAFSKPHPIDIDRVNAQQARRILDRIVGYQVSPLLWKKVARGLSAGRVQSVAVRVVVEREREIRSFVPDEYWAIDGAFSLNAKDAQRLGPEWKSFLGALDEKGNPPSMRQRNIWVGEHKGLRAELTHIGDEKVNITLPGSGGDAEFETAEAHDLTPIVARISKAAGLINVESTVVADDKGRGPARWKRTISGEIDHSASYKIAKIETRRTTSRPTPPFITSTLQQAASSRLGFAARRTMRTAQALYEGVDIPGEGPVGLITYMRTDSTHLSGTAVNMVREFIGRQFGAEYLPDKPNSYSSSNKQAQEAHEAIRPTNLEYPPSRVRSALSSDQFKLYSLVWQRFIACQMMPAKWDATTVSIVGGTDPKQPCTFKATGRTLVFDGFYKVTGVPTATDEQHLPALAEKDPMYPFAIEPTQKFSSPPPRFTEASLIKILEAEGIGRPSTYADIIQKIQDRKYVELISRRFFATHLGEIVTDKLTEAFPGIMEVSYTRAMEAELDKVEEEHMDFIEMLRRFYTPFKDNLEHAMENLSHAKAEMTPAPKEYRCADCDSDMVYRFGKNGRFLSCSKYPECSYACPCDRDGKPRPAETVNVACHKCGAAMIKRSGRYGPFLGCPNFDNKETPCDGILNINKKGFVVAPSQPPVETDLPCPKCEAPLNLRNGIRGPWLGCSKFPRCRGRGKWSELSEEEQKRLEGLLEANDRANPIPIIKMMDGRALTDPVGKPLNDAPPADKLVEGAESEPELQEEELESVA